MAKRSAEERKEPTKRPCTVQPTMFKFYYYYYYCELYSQY